jgi:hypothetical protein
MHPSPLVVTAVAVVMTTPLTTGAAHAQQARTGSVMDHTMVPRGRVRLGVEAIYTSWDERFGWAPDGTTQLEELGSDLTDPTSLSLYPGMPTLRGAVRDLTGLPGYDPVLGSTDGRISQSVITADLGLHVGVFDWLTVGAVLPRARTRTTVDQYFAPDTVAGNLGLNPTITDGGAVDAFLGSTIAADANATQYAATVCAAGPSLACSDAQALADRTTGFSSSIQGAYGATPFFPATGSTSGDALQAEAAALSTELQALGLGALPSLPLATDPVTTEGYASIPALRGGGIEASELETRRGLWGMGDLELSARVRVLDNLTPGWAPEETYLVDRQAAERAGPWLRYRVTASFLARLPTGLSKDPDVLLDIGRGDAQTDFEAGATAELRFGRLLGLVAGGRYGIQESTTLVRRVAPLDLVMPPLSTRRSVVYDPGFYLVVGAAPVVRITDGLSLHGEYRFFHKGRDQFELVTPDPELDPTVLEINSGIKQHQAGAGLRYDTVSPWMAGAGGFPMEIHLRLLHTFEGSGGHAPKVTRVEAGARIFQRIWGPDR